MKSRGMLKGWVLQTLQNTQQGIWNSSLVEKNKNFSETCCYLLPEPFEPIRLEKIGQSIVTRFAEQVLLYPKQLAIKTENAAWTYEKLNQEINRIACVIKDIVSKENSQIVLLLNDVNLAIASLFAVLKTGHAYVPLDSDFPEQRLHYMIVNSQASLIITDQHNSTLVKNLSRGIKIPVLNPIEFSVRHEQINIPISSNAESNAYLLYTSGTTGKPKGVLQTHRNVLHFNRIYTNALHIRSQDRLSLLASYSFDAAVMDIFAALLNGATLFPYLLKIHDAEKCLEWLQQEKITVYHSTPTVFRYLMQAVKNPKKLSSLRLVVLGGEEAQRKDFQLYRRYCPDHCLLINNYGPTEASVGLQYFMNKQDILANRRIPIGYAVENTKVYLLNSYDRNGQVYGEIAIQNSYISPGYWRMPTLNKQVFKKVNHSRLYRTGDMGCLLPDGAIEFLGRKDDQIKIRGFRVELGEITESLLNHPNIQQATCQMIRDDKNSLCIVAYFVSDKSLARNILKKYLRRLLPDYMMPIVFVQCNSIPLKLNGKVNYRALPFVDLTKRNLENKFIKPRNVIEKLLTNIWIELLSVKLIGIHDDFFEIGGNSLLATQMVSQIREKFFVELPLRSVFEKPTIAELARIIIRLKRQEENCIPLLIRRKNKSLAPAAFAQQRLWFLMQLNPNIPIYSLTKCIRLTGDLNVVALQKAFYFLLQRHESLRTTFRVCQGQLEQVIHKKPLCTLEIQEFENIPQDQQDRVIQSLANEEARYIFDLFKGPLIRGTILRFHPTYHVLLINISHLIVDRWSLAIFTEELSLLYNAFIENKPSPLLALPIQYADFSVWQREYLQGNVLKKLHDYWQCQLSDTLDSLSLPTDYARPPVFSHQGNLYKFIIDAPCCQQLQGFSQQHNVTLFVTLFSVFQVLLYRYTRQDDIVVGVPVANRTRVDTENIIGCFVNTLPLRGRCDSRFNFLQFLKQIRAMTLDAYEHQDLPFEKMIEMLKLPRHSNRNPLFQVMFALHNTQEQLFQLNKVVAQVDDVNARVALFDLSLDLEPFNGSLLARLEYNTDLFSEAMVKQFAQHYKQLIRSCLSQPNKKLGKLLLLTSEDKQHLLNINDVVACEYPKNKALHELFECCVVRWPNRVALVFGDTTLTYRELNKKANQFAHYLREQGIRPELCIALCMRRSVEMVICIFGILKTGAVYVPFDPDCPSERLTFMLEDSQATLLVIHSEFIGKFQAHDEIPQILIDKEWNLMSRQPTNNLSTRMLASHAMYVLYTSGSTGTPKGVVVEHRNAVHMLTVLQKNYPFQQTDAYLFKTNYTFDDSVAELFGWFWEGGRLVILEPDGEKDPRKIIDTIYFENITHIVFVPTLLQILMDILDNTEKLSSLKYLFVGAEPISKELVLCILQQLPKHTVFTNLYGATETTINATYFPLNNSDIYSSIPIGKPLPNVAVYILDDYLEFVPIGVKGELYIGGDGIARGYLNRPELTAEKFIKNPFSDDPHSRLYKTGDMCRWLADGNIEFLGRSDFQVKIRGFRIELGEIEYCLDQHPAIKQTLAAVREDNFNEKQLIAYFIPHSNAIPTNNSLRHFLSAYLSDYMIPIAFVPVTEFPLTSSGKLNRRALPLPDTNHWARETTHVSPRNSIESRLVILWSELLHQSFIGIYDNFFYLGGHSLLATQILTRLQREFHVEMSLRDFFKQPTVAAMADYITQQTHLEKTVPLIPVSRKKKLPLSFAQQRLWFIDQLEHSGLYNITEALLLSGKLNEGILESALNALMERHEILRTSFPMRKGQPYQHIFPFLKFNLIKIDLSMSSEKKQQKQIQFRYREEKFQSFDLQKGPLLRGQLLRLNEKRHVFLFTLHHTIADAWSVRILLRDFAELYSSLLQKRRPELPLLPIQYADFAYRQRQYLTGKILQCQLDFWKQELIGAPPLLHVPTDHPRPALQSYRGKLYTFSLPKDIYKKLNILSRQRQATLFMTLLAAFYLLLYRYTGQKDIVVGTTIANRNRFELEELIGFFANTLALRQQFSEDISFITILNEIKNKLLAAYDHQELPFEKLISHLNIERNLSYSPLFQVMFTLEKEKAIDKKVDEVQFSLMNVDSLEQLSKFDMTWYLHETDKNMMIRIEYTCALFEESTIIRMAQHWQQLLVEIVISPERSIARIPFLTTVENEQLLKMSEIVEKKHWPQETVHTLFEQCVERWPNHVAIVFDNTLITYRKLNERANQFAHYLRKKGVQEEELVAVCLPRSLELITCIFGVLKAGAAYIPLDPNYPTQRLKFMIKDSQAKLLVIHSQLLSKFSSDFPCIPIDLEQDIIAEQSEMNLSVNTLASHPMYVIYTSGSTGVPKGVVVEHRQVANILTTLQHKYPLCQKDAYLFKTNDMFDVSVTELFGWFWEGGRLVILEPDAEKDPDKILAIIHSVGITHINFVPTLLQVMLDIITDSDQLNSLKYLFIAGESLSKELVTRTQQQLPPYTEVVNMYGPTEATIYATDFNLKDSEVYPCIPIGKPLPNVKTYILDACLQLVPIGVKGELYIGGDGIARGYLNRPELTVEKFIKNPFSDDPHSRLYKTGDICRWLVDGNIEFLGRSDFQVKIRGFRIELGEIEQCLMQHPKIKNAVVLLQEFQGYKQLVAYLTSVLDEEALRRYLKQCLPHYMIPSRFIILDQFPLLVNGKIDRQALPVTLNKIKEYGHIAPRNVKEKTIIEIWQKVLRLKSIGVNDNFFSLGGDSILSIQIIAQCRQKGLSITPKDMFLYQTPAELAQQATYNQNSQMEQGLASGGVPLTPIQHWFFNQSLKNPHHFNQAVLLEIKQNLSIEIIEQAVHFLIQHHDALRLRFNQRGKKWCQYYCGLDKSIKVQVIKLNECDEKQRRQCVEQKANELQAGLNITTGPIIQVVYFDSKTLSKRRLLIIIHHLVVDGVSWRILLEDLQTIFEQLICGKTITLPRKTHSYQAWSEQLMKEVHSDVIRKEIAYWERLPVNEKNYFPLKSTIEENTHGSTCQVEVSLSPLETKILLYKIPKIARIQMNDILLAALVLAYRKWTGQERLWIDLESHGRELIGHSLQLDRTVGWFTSIFPVLLDISRMDGLGNILKQIKEQLRAIPHNGLGYGIARYLMNDSKINKKIKRFPIPCVSFNYLGRLELPGEWMFCWAEESLGETCAAENLCTHIVDINCWVKHSQFIMQWTISKNQQKTIKQWASNYIQALRDLIAYCSTLEKPLYVAADFPLAKLAQDDFVRLLGNNKQGHNFYALTSLQEIMLNASLDNQEEDPYVLQTCFSLSGKICLKAFREVWGTIVDRYDIFRTAFCSKGLSKPVQCVFKQVNLLWNELDWRHMSRKQKKSQWEQFLVADRRNGFKLDEAPLMRFTAIRLANDSYYLIWTYHHLIIDGWCFSLLFQELFSEYENNIKNVTMFPIPRASYWQYIAWLQKQDVITAENFWKEYLKDLNLFILPIYNKESNGDYEFHRLTLSDVLTGQLKQVAYAQQVTLNHIIQATWAKTFAHFCQQQDILIGVVFSGRSATLEGIDQIVGPCINILPLRISSVGELSESSLLQRVKQSNVEVSPFHHTPLAKIREYLKLGDKNRLFDSVIYFENYPFDKSLFNKQKEKGINCKIVQHFEMNHYPISLWVTPSHCLSVRFGYQNAYFSNTLVSNLANEFLENLNRFAGCR